MVLLGTIRSITVTSQQAPWRLKNGISTVYSTVCAGAHHRKHQSSLAFWGECTSDRSNAENVCTREYISVTKWYILGYGTGASWDLWDRSIKWEPSAKLLGVLWVYSLLLRQNFPHHDAADWPLLPLLENMRFRFELGNLLWWSIICMRVCWCYI